MKTRSTIGAAAILTLVVTAACTQEPLVNNDNALKNEYIKQWIQTFGVVSQDQTWNAAEPVIAEVHPAAFGKDITVYIYTKSPASGGKLIGKSATTASLRLDMPKGTSSVFVQARDSKGHVYTSTYMPVRDGLVQIGTASSRASRSGVTLGNAKVFDAGAAGQEVREAYNPDNPYDISEAMMLDDDKYLWLVDMTSRDKGWGSYSYDFTFENIYGEEVKFSDVQYYFDFNSSGYTAYGGFTDEQYAACSLVTRDMNKRLINRVSPRQVYQRLNGVETSRDCVARISDMAPLFGRGAYFEEQRRPESCLEKWKNDFHPDVTFLVSGELTLDYMYGATQNRNIFGYYYWSDWENPRDAVKYILIDDARPQHNISINTADNFIADGMSLSSIMLAQNPDPADSEDMIIGTSYRVPYFDPDGNMSYEFPEGTHIAFFLVVNGYEGGSEGSADSSWLSYTNRSVRSHNYEFQRTFSGYSINGHDADDTEGEIDAISLKYKQTIHLCFEDRGGDKDMNDIVFFMRGNIEADYKPNPDAPMLMSMILNLDFDNPLPPLAEPDGTNVPSDDPGVITGAGAQTWLLACEDLGSSDDYDFNDIVLSVAHVAGETKAVVTPMAAGGVMRTIVLYDGQPIKDTEDASEIHNMIRGNTANDYSMINTSGYFRPGRSFEIKVPADFSISRDLSRFSLLVEGAGDPVLITAPLKGDVPQIMCLPGNWRWPRERVKITEAYPAFKDWNKDSQSIDWIDSAVSGRVMDR